MAVDGVVLEVRFDRSSISVSKVEMISVGSD
jgi:hypothetical protein